MMTSVAQEVVPKASALNCPSCGAGIEMHAHGWAVSVVCAACGAQLDATDANLRILQYGERQIFAPRIPLGTRGTWKGAPWEVIGSQRVTITVDDVDYSWVEYVCFNPYRGFLYLSEYEGHWNVIEKLKWQPRGGFVEGQHTLTYGGTAYKHFQTAVARTTAALGEFPWELRVGDTITSHDYVAPPFILSVEVSGGEVTISQGTYTRPEVIAKAFGLDALRNPSGVFANQPNPHKELPKRMGERFMLAMLALFAMLILNVTLAANKVVFSESYTYDRSVPNSAFVTPAFELEGRPSGVSIGLNGALDNDWVFFTIALINEQTGETREVSRQLDYYSGRDSDGTSWSEGDRSETLRLSSVPAGRYFLRIEPEGGEIGKQRVDYSVQVQRDAPHFGFYVLAFLAILAPMVLGLFPAAAFESRRWAESDHPIGETSSSGDDE